MVLRDVLQLVSGVPFKGRLESDSRGSTAVVQARDLSLGAGIVRPEGAARVRNLTVSQKAWLQAGDLLLQPRGSTYPVGEFVGAEGNAVAAAPLLILRPDRRLVFAPFLAAFLRAPGTQAILRQAAVGTHVLQVPRKAIELLPIALPDLHRQAVLAEIARLDQLECQLMSAVRATRGRLFDLAIKEAARAAPAAAMSKGEPS